MLCFNPAENPFWFQFVGSLLLIQPTFKLRFKSQTLNIMEVTTSSSRSGDQKICDNIRERRKFLKEFIERVDLKHAALIGAWVRCFHFMAPPACMVLVVIGPRWVARFSIAFLIAVISAYLYFRGCMLTWLEKKLCSEDVNIADWLLVVLGHKTDQHNRNVITLFFFPCFFTFIILVYYCRFG
jgi:hypothetical protein